MGVVSKEREREFEKQHILRQAKRYLATNVLSRVEYDHGYAEKVALLEAFLEDHPGGLILDVGSNTAGEAEVLAHRGHPIVATDINEHALALSLRRSRAFGREGPVYYAADAHRLPFQSGTFGSVIAFEVLHHFEFLEAVLTELHRVLRPGGRLFAYEPYALNPYRRLAELRFIALGSIERSFTVRGIQTRLERAGLDIVSLSRHVLPPSVWKKRSVSRLRAGLKDLYYSVSRRALPVFGNVVVVAQKPSDGSAGHEATSDSVLQCPVTGTSLEAYADCFVSTGPGARYRYPIVDGIPVLVAEDAQVVSTGET